MPTIYARNVDEKTYQKLCILKLKTKCENWAEFFKLVASKLSLKLLTKQQS